MLTLAADLLLLLGALSATLYCFVLSRRLKRFNDLETGVGGAIAVLSAQVDDMTRTLESARQIAQQSATTLDGMTDRAEHASRRLELLMASLHDLPDPPDAPDDADAAAAAGSVASDSATGSAADPSAAGSRPARAPPEVPQADAPTSAVEAVSLFLSQRKRAGGSR